VTTVTQAGREPGDTMIVEVVRGSGPAVRRANPEREPGRSRAARRSARTRRCRRPHRAHGPPSRERTPQRPRPENGRGRRNEVLSMATIKNVCNKIERMSALQGWRMRWHMQ